MESGLPPCPGLVAGRELHVPSDETPLLVALPVEGRVLVRLGHWFVLAFFGLPGNLTDPLGGSVGDSRERPKQQDPGEPFGPPGSALVRMPECGCL
jgi:hypothetical protein